MPGRSLTGPIGSPLKASCRTSRWLQTGSAPTSDAPHWCREPRGHPKRRNSPCHPIFPFPELIQIIGAALPFVLPCCTRKYWNMPDKSITKVSSAHSPKGRFGEKYLASRIHISMRLWEREEPAETKTQTARDYETVGLVLEGKAELHIEGQFERLEKGDSWVVPKAHAILTRLSKPLLQLKRPAHLRRCMAGTNNHGGATSTPAEIYKATL
jgi:mannose-6-phosphate isomerase-like protein (cupin superfamily)